MSGRDRADVEAGHGDARNAVATPVGMTAANDDPGERQFRAFVMATSDAVYRMSPDWSEMRQLHGQSFLADTNDATPRWIERSIPADDVERVNAAIGHAIATRTMFELEHRMRRADGRFGWTLLRAVPIIGRDGEIVEWLGTATDMDGVRTQQRQQEALLAEVQHRVRNSLAVIRSIVRRTAANSADVDQFSMHLDGRLASFARTQAAAIRDPLGGLDLRGILLDELAAHVVREGERAFASGPDIALGAKAAGLVGLAFHELATNAVKFGAFAVATGVVRISWTIEAEADDLPWLHLVWDETRAGDPVPPPVRRGFGFEFLENTLPYELGATTDIAVRPAGVRCAIRFALSAEPGDSAAPPDRDQAGSEHR